MVATIMNKSVLGLILATGLLGEMPASATSTTIQWEAQASKRSNLELNASTPYSSLVFNWDPTSRRFISPTGTLIIQTAGHAAYNISTQLIHHQPNSGNNATLLNASVTLDTTSATISSRHTNTLSTPQTITSPPSNADTRVNFTLSSNKSPLREDDLKELNNDAHQGEIELLFTASWATNIE
jgi:hypothetical protein